MIRIFSLLFFLGVTTGVLAQQKIEGRIIDEETGKPVPYASIGVMGTSKGTSSNLQGEFSLVITGTLSLKVTCIGYESKWITSPEQLNPVLLKPVATQLNEIFVFEKAVNARHVVRKAFSSIKDNYDTRPFLQNFFYRNYCKDDSVYGRLVEASVDVWKNRGYLTVQKAAGDHEEIRVTQLRRSIDQSAVAQGHEPLLIHNVLQADLIAYQKESNKPHLSFYDDVNSLRSDIQNYTFTFSGITTYDGQEVYKIQFEHRPDSILMTTGYVSAPSIKGTLFITTDTHAIIRADEIKQDGPNHVFTSAYYRKYNSRYYPYHFIREGESKGTRGAHWYHIELMSVEINQNTKQRFAGGDLSKDALLKIPYDTLFWNGNTTLKTTPLENDIIRDLGGGASLNEQFQLYHDYEQNTSLSGENGEVKFQWFQRYAKGRIPVYLIFWSGNFMPYLTDLEYAKRLNKQFHNQIKFVFISTETDDAKWQQTVHRYNLFSDGIIHYRVDHRSALLKQFNFETVPAFVLISKDGTILDLQAKSPSNPSLVNDLKALIK